MAHVAILKAHNRALRKGSDPRAATCRSKLQSKRAKLNQEINKELRLRAGAENLLRATENRKLRETIALELSFVNSNLQLLKEQLAELNSSVEVYQSPDHDALHKQAVIPMIPLGLKETKEISFQQVLQEFIEGHYKEDPAEFEEAIAELSDFRQAMRTPSRDQTGVALLYEYYNQLYFFERRFCSPEKNLGIYFEWYDSLTGAPSAQRTVAFEKACVLFNLGALHTQIGARQDRRSESGLDSAVDNYLRAASVFRYIIDNFTNAPSMDLAPDVLEAMVSLLLTQARECLFDKLTLNYASNGRRNIDSYLEQAQEAAELSESYKKVYHALNIDVVKDYVPASWIALVQVKSEYYKAIAHGNLGQGLFNHRGSLTEETKETLGFLYKDENKTADRKSSKYSTVIDIRLPKDDIEKMQLARSHLRESVMVHEEALRLQRMCRELKKRDHLTSLLRDAHDAATDAFTLAKDDDKFIEVFDPPQICAATKFQLSFGQPDFELHPVEDTFRRLGPLSLFSAKQKWASLKRARLRKLPDQGFGFSVRGDGPIVIAGVDGGSIADLAGVAEGDVVIGIGDVDVKWSTHEEVVALIKSARDDLTLKLATPAEKPAHPKPANKKLASGLPVNVKGSSTSPMSTTSSSSGVSSAASHLSSSMASSKSCDRLNISKPLEAKTRRRDKSLDSHVRYRTDASKKSTSMNRLSLAIDFLHLNRTVSKESVARSEYRTRITWNPFRRHDKSRERERLQDTKKTLNDGLYKKTFIR